MSALQKWEDKASQMNKMILLTFLIVTTSLCLSGEETISGAETELVIINRGDILPPEICGQNDLQTSIIVIHSEHCHACAIALPRIQKISQELGVEVKYFDLDNIEQREKLMEYGFIPMSVPTLLMNCEAHVGVKSEEGYRILLGGFG